MDAILITQCVQRDFVRPLGVGEPLPNLVHVGRMEAERICGPLGGLVPFLERAHAVEPARLAIIHVGDHHDRVRHAAHLERFRPHCIAGSDGARLVEPIDRFAASRGAHTYFVEAGDLNDFEESPLDEMVSALIASRRDEVRIGVVGVWTDAKVSFLLYDLRTRLRIEKLGTCSALTASRSIGAHHGALQALQGTLGVELFHSPGSFLEWLVPGAAPEPLPAARILVFARSCPAPAQWEPAWVAEREALLSSVLLDRHVTLAPLGGGFSGAQVFVARADDGSAHVVKVGRRDEVARERYGNERIGRILGDAIPELLSYREGSALAAMELELAASDEQDVETPTTFKRTWEEAVEDEEPPTSLDLPEEALESALGRVLWRLYRNAEKDNVDLLECYGFVDRRGNPLFGEGVTRVAEEIARECGHDSAAEMISARQGSEGESMAPADFYGRWLGGRSLPREVPVCLVHGDLNLANILVGRRRSDGRLARIWVIDFARLATMPCLTDLAKVENDLTYILGRIPGRDAFPHAVELQEARLGGETLTDLAAFQAVAEPGDRRHVRATALLRGIAAEIDPRGREAMDDYRVALLRYAAHTLSFDEPGNLDRGLALLAVGRLAAQVAAIGKGLR